jgi:hypothetical protein
MAAKFPRASCCEMPIPDLIRSSSRPIRFPINPHDRRSTGKLVLMVHCWYFSERGHRVEDGRFARALQLILDKPRTYQVAIATLGSNGLGSPLFDTKGGLSACSSCAAPAPSPARSAARGCVLGMSRNK